MLSPEQLPEVEGYEVLGILGHGGMGIVFRARHLRLNRPVALKMILAGAFALPAQRQRFLREAEAVAAISHPNIVQVYNAGEAEGRPWFTMELVEGGDLQSPRGFSFAAETRKNETDHPPARTRHRGIAILAGAARLG